jgi:ubiquinone/menaquinone biosynthesis C-methylase UbiE
MNAVETMNSHRFKLSDAESYDSLASEFDRFSEHLSAPLAERMITLAQLMPGENVLDIGTGTGVVAFKASPRVVPNGSVVGIDLSEGMLALATRKAQQRGCGDRLEFRRMDAEALQFDDASFDVVLSLFALLHFPAPSSALAQMFKVLRPGGRVVVGVGSGPRYSSVDGLIEGFKHLYRRELRRRGKLLVAPDFLVSLADKYFPRPHEPEQSELAHHGAVRSHSVLSLIREAKFDVTQTFWQGHLARFDTAEEFWSVQRTFSSIARKRLSNAPDNKLDQLYQEFLGICRKVQSKGGSLSYPFGAFYVVARKPPASRFRGN